MAKKKSGKRTKAGPPPAPDASMRIIILHGKDALRIRDWSNQLIEVLNERYGEIQRFDYDGAQTEPAVVLDELRSYGLLQQHKLVVLEQADQFLVAQDDDDDDISVKGGRRKSSRQLMEAYAQKPAEDATLLMRAETWKPGKLDKIVATVGIVGKFEPPNDGEAIDWILNEGATRYEVKVNKNAAELLVEKLGCSLDRLNVELAKLASFVGPGKAIDRELVVEMVGLSREEEAWIIQDAIASGNPLDAIVKLRELLDVSRHSVVPLMWSVIDLIRKLHASSVLMRQGMDDWTVAKQVGLWGDGKNTILIAAKKLDPEQLAQLLRDAVQADFKVKSGQGDSKRSLEVLALRVADTIGST
ncbi:MAG: DNA polymerase III subunit delta [Planctomycetota bacterium]|nr:DNA polymerase III subunit delta [Planctomycetota bacterium]